MNDEIILRHPIITEDLLSILGADLPWERFDNTSVLVSGANGIVPAYLVESLLFRNECLGRIQTKVIAMVRNEAKARARYSAYASRADLQIIVHDVSQPIEINEPIDFVIHAASQASPKYYNIDPVGTHIANTVGTYNLLKLAKDHNAKAFLFISSGEVYGDTSSFDTPITENDFGPLNPTALRACYGESKRAGENLCVCWHHQYALLTKIARLSHTYGPGMLLDDGRVFADFVACAVQGKDIVLTSDGKAIRPFCYLSDAAKGLFTILLLGSPGQAYNLANDEAFISIRELADVVASLASNPNCKVIVDNSSAASNYLSSTQKGNIPSTQKIRNLGWFPSVTVREGFQRTIATYR